jgi:PadR family transcriptional regulator, regulatory protein PadR
MNFKGSLPLLILHVLSSGAQYGYQIAQHIKLSSDGVLDFKEGTLYPMLHSLEKDELITSYTVEENGRLRRYYEITGKGQQRLDQEKEGWKQYTTAVNLVLERGMR